MRLFLAVGLVALSLSGCGAKDAPSQFQNISWEGNQTFDGSAVRWDGAGEAIFDVYLECSESVYAWFSTDEGVEGSLDARIFDANGTLVHEAEFGDDNHEQVLDGAAGQWKMSIHSHPDFDGNGMAFLECVASK